MSETTAALVQDREAQRRSLKERLVALEARRGTGPLRADADIITGQLARLNDLLGRDIARANAFFRADVAPIICTPVREAGRKFYRATAAANGSEMIKSLGLAQAFDFGGCGGPQCTDGKQVARVSLQDPDLEPAFPHRRALYQRIKKLRRSLGLFHSRRPATSTVSSPSIVAVWALRAPLGVGLEAIPVAAGFQFAGFARR